MTISDSDCRILSDEGVVRGSERLGDRRGSSPFQDVKNLV